jgi:hypothetical protein
MTFLRTIAPPISLAAGTMAVKEPRQARRHPEDRDCADQHRASGARAAHQPVREEIIVAVVEEHEIMRRGVMSILTKDDRLRVTTGWAADTRVDVAVVSSRAAASGGFSCPIIICSRVPDHDVGPSSRNEVVAALDSASLAPEQLPNGATRR